MEKITTQQNDLLLDFLDGTLSGAEAAMLKKQLEQSTALQRRLEELRLVHTFLNKKSLSNTKLSLDFTEQVMNNLDRAPATSNSISPRNGLLLLFGIIVATTIAMLLLATGSFDGLDTPISLEALKIPKGIISHTVDSVPFNVKMMMKILIIINIALALVVLDRTVLKPYFERRHKSQSFS